MAIVVNFKLENMRPRLTYALSSRTVNAGGVFVWIPASKKGVGVMFFDYQKIANTVICPPSYLLAFSSMYSFTFLVRWWHDCFRTLADGFIFQFKFYF